MTSIAQPARAARWERWRVPVALGAGVLAAFATGRLAARSPLLAAAAVLGPLLGSWALRRVEVALVLLLAVITLLPFGVVPVRLGVAPTFLDLATVTISFVWLARAAAGKSPTRLTGVGGALLVFVGVTAAAYVLAGEPLVPNETGRTFGKVVAAHLIFIPLFNLIVDPTGVRRVLRWLAGLATLEALAGIALYALPRDLAFRLLVALGPLGYPTDDTVLRYRPETSILRANGTSVDPNMLGALLMIAAAIVVPQFFAVRPVVNRWQALLALGPLGLCLLLTESRGTWLGLAGGVLLVGVLRYRRLWLAAGAAGILALVLPQAGRFTGHLIEGLRAQDPAAAMRVGELRNAVAVITQHPWFGAGWSTEGKSLELAFTYGVSNVLLTVAERSGLIAAAAYVGVLVVLAVQLWPAVRATLRRPVDDGILLGLVAALAAAQIGGLLDHYFVRFPHLITLLWLVAALAVRESECVCAKPIDPQGEASPLPGRWE
jgi:O-antigen ligase